jgi:hypothetical protein
MVKCFAVLYFLMTMIAQAEMSSVEPELRRLALMPPADLIQSIQKRVDLFRFKREGIGPQSMVALQEIPEMSEQMYRQFKKEILFGAAGLYLSPHDARFAVRRPTIIVREDATPWVLIHEYAHFALDELRHAKNKENADESLTLLQDNLEGFTENLNSFRAAHSQFRDSRHEDETGASLMTASKLRMKLMRVFELEEIAIENSLRNIYESQNPHNLDQEDYENSSNYIKKNQDSVRRGLSFLHDSISELHTVWSQSNIRDTLMNLQLEMALILQSMI